VAQIEPRFDRPRRGSAIVYGNRLAIAPVDPDVDRGPGPGATYPELHEIVSQLVNLRRDNLF
jgi:hypothetical protein